MKTLLIFIIMINIAVAQTSSSPEQKGLEITKKVDEANSGFKGEIANIQLTLINAQGDKIVRKLNSKVKEEEKDGDKSLSIFELPADVKGTKMLTHTHKNEDDDQWLFMPKLNRVKRISSSNKTASFMGSEFSYEDLGSQEIEKYTYKYIKDDVFNGRKVWIVERYPVNKKSGYKKQISYIDQEKLTALKVDYFNRRGDLLKTATFSDFKEYKIGNKKMFRANKIFMDNKLTRKQSELLWLSRNIGAPVKDSDFMAQGLKDGF